MRSGGRPPPRVESVVKRFRIGQTDVAALDGVGLLVRPGEFVAVMGASGSGKSTLLHVMAGLTDIDAGRVFVDGQDLGGLSDSHLIRVRRRRIGLVFQQFNLIPSLTALENVMLPVLAGAAAGPTAVAPRLAVAAPAAELLRPDDIRNKLASGFAAEGARKQAYFVTALSILASAFIIFTTLSMEVNERARQLAVLRAVGLRRFGLSKLVLSEAILIAFAASALSESGVRGAHGVDVSRAGPLRQQPVVRGRDDATDGAVGVPGLRLRTHVRTVLPRGPRAGDSHRPIGTPHPPASRAVGNVTPAAEPPPGSRHTGPPREPPGMPGRPGHRSSRHEQGGHVGRWARPNRGGVAVVGRNTTRPSRASCPRVITPLLRPV
jgi:ABC-type branched-subunit amino acid transport system ATPase component